MSSILDSLLSQDTPINRNPVPDISQAVTPSVNPARSEEDKWHSRHSGIAGTARDILGGLGDFLLSRLHMGTPYANSKHQHELNYAAQGIDSSDPNEALAAIKRVQGIDFATGVKLRDQFIDNQRLAASQASTAEDRAQRLSLAQAGQDQKNRQQAASYLNTIAGFDPAKRKAAYDQALSNVRALATRNGSDISSWGLPDTLNSEDDVNQLTSFIGGSVPVAQQWSVKQRQEQIDNQASQAETRNATTIRGQDLSHEDRQASIAHADARAAAGRAAAAARAARRSSTAPDRNVMVYTGDDGYRYAETRGGKTIRSTHKVRTTTTKSGWSNLQVN